MGVFMVDILKNSRHEILAWLNHAYGVLQTFHKQYGKSCPAFSELDG
jgi:hypothetical protein